MELIKVILFLIYLMRYALSWKFNQAQREENITGFCMKGMQKGITHRLFADDLMVCCSQYSKDLYYLNEAQHIVLHQGNP